MRWAVQSPPARMLKEQMCKVLVPVPEAEHPAVFTCNALEGRGQTPPGAVHGRAGACSSPALCGAGLDHHGSNVSEKPSQSTAEVALRHQFIQEMHFWSLLLY